MTNLINVTPHVLNIHFGEEVETLPPSGSVARCQVTETLVEEINGIPVYETEFGELSDLPDPAPGVVYVASMVVAKAAIKAGRTDVRSPGSLLRDADGKPLGCKGLSLPR